MTLGEKGKRMIRKRPCKPLGGPEDHQLAVGVAGLERPHHAVRRRRVTQGFPDDEIPAANFKKQFHDVSNFRGLNRRSGGKTMFYESAGFQFAWCGVVW